MKVFIVLGAHSEYTGFSIYLGAYTSLKDAIDAKWNERVKSGTGAFMMMHKQVCEENGKVSHFVAFQSRNCNITEEEFKQDAEYFAYNADIAGFEIIEEEI